MLWNDESHSGGPQPNIAAIGLAPRIAGENLGRDANLRGNEGEHVGRRIFLHLAFSPLSDQLS